MIFIDPPYWPAHGTVFSHLVSDTSVAELHRFAASAGIAARAFDLDHYDVPQRRYAALVAAGAVPVDGKELVRILLASGLRVPARQRGKNLRKALTLRWDRLLPGCPALGAALLERWSEPHRHYHSGTHLLAVLEALDLLAEDPVPRTVSLAAWFHDAVYDGVPGADEEASAALAERSLTGILDGAEVAEVARLVRLTAGHAPAPGDDDGALLRDADLAVLGGTPSAYARYVTAVRADYAHVPAVDFARGRAAVVRGLLAQDPLFHTATGRRLWEAAARANLAGEIQAVTDPADG